MDCCIYNCKEIILINFLTLDNEIGDEGAKVIGETLKTNRSLTQINLGLELFNIKNDQFTFYTLYHSTKHNEIGSDGTKIIADGLKANTTLTHINLKDKAVQQTLL